MLVLDVDICSSSFLCTLSLVIHNHTDVCMFVIELITLFALTFNLGDW